jgi:hypothetical protein
VQHKRRHAMSLDEVERLQYMRTLPHPAAM